MGQVPGDRRRRRVRRVQPRGRRPGGHARLDARPTRRRSARPAPTAPSPSCERILGEEPDGVDRVNELLARAVEPLRPEGRALYAGLRPLATARRPLGAMWRRGDMLREFRGDSHIAAWIARRRRRHRDRPADRAVLGSPDAHVQPHAGLDRRAVRRRAPSGSRPAASSPTARSPTPAASCARSIEVAHRRARCGPAHRRPRRRRRRAVRHPRARGAQAVRDAKGYLASGPHDLARAATAAELDTTGTVRDDHRRRPPRPDAGRRRSPRAPAGTRSRRGCAAARSACPRPGARRDDGTVDVAGRRRSPRHAARPRRRRTGSGRSVPARRPGAR